MVPSLPGMPGPGLGVPVTGGQYPAQTPLQCDRVGVSGANQYTVNPWAVVSTVTPPIVAVLRVPPAGAGAGPPAAATEMPSTTRAAPDRPATARPAPGMPAWNRASIRLPPVACLACRPGVAGVAARAASAAKAATSITPATMPAVVRISLKPNRPIHTDSRYPPRVDRANPAPAAARSRLPVASTAAARPNAVITCSRNSQPRVGIGRYPVRYRSRWIAPDAASSPAPASRNPN